MNQIVPPHPTSLEARLEAGSHGCAFPVGETTPAGGRRVEGDLSGWNFHGLAILRMISLGCGVGQLAATCLSFRKSQRWKGDGGWVNLSQITDKKGESQVHLLPVSGKQNTPGLTQSL